MERASIVAKKVSRWAHMILFGLTSFRLDRTRHRRIFQSPKRKFLTAHERWAILGNRLREATEKVVEQNERRQ